MSTSILYHAFGLKGIECRATRFLADIIIFSAEMNKQRDQDSQKAGLRVPGF